MTTPTPEQFLGMPSTEDEEDEAPAESAATPGQVVENGTIKMAGSWNIPEAAVTGGEDLAQTWNIGPGTVWQSPEPDYLQQIAGDVRAVREHLTGSSGPYTPSVTVYEAISADATAAEVARVIGKQAGEITYPAPAPGSPADLSTPSFERVSASYRVTDDVEADLVSTDYAELYQQALEMAADHEAQLQTLTELVDEIKGIVKPSKSQVSLEVKAAIERWANPVVEPDQTEEYAAAEAVVEGAPNAMAPASPHTRATVNGGPDVCQECSVAAQEYVQWPCPAAEAQEPDAVLATVVVEHTDPVQPQPTDHVEAWRAYAREVQPEKKWEGMNRSQIRTALGLSHPSEGGA